MNHDSTSSTSGADTPGISSTPISSSTFKIPSSPIVPSSPALANLIITEEEAMLLLTPEGLSRREYNLFKRKRKAALIEAEKKAKAAANSDLPEGYTRGDFGRQARKLTKSHDKHGMLSPGTHGVVKPAEVRYYQYKKCFRVAEDLAKRKEKSQSKKRGGIRMV
jgi:hypothetical protein